MKNYKRYTLRFALVLLLCVAAVTIVIPKNTVKAQTLYPELSVHVLTSGTSEDYHAAIQQSYDCDGEGLIPVTIPSDGCLYLDVHSRHAGGHSGYLYRTADASDSPDTLSCVTRNEGGIMADGNTSKFLTAGTYYLQMPKDGYQFSAVFYSQADRTLKNNTWTTAYSDYRNETYFTYKTTDSGYLTIVEEALIDSGFSAEVTLCNSKKEPLVDAMPNHSINDRIVYALKKNTTYHIKVTAIDSNIRQFYRLKVAFSKRSDTSGAKKSKARKVSFGKTASGMILAEDALDKADWYQVTNPKKQSIAITYGGSITSGSMILEVYNAKGKKIGSYAVVSRLGETNSYHIENKNGSTVLAKGTYYFKVTKSRKTACGIYSIKASKG